MNKYDNVICPVCKAKIFPEDMVVCPDCGAPHHRECYKKLGHCFYEDKHGTEELWTAEKQKPIDEPALKCPNCGSLAKDGSEFCKNCGKSLNSDSQPQFNDNSQPANDAFNQTDKSYDPEGNPFFIRNGLNANEEIEGQKISHIASFVGYNALRYIRVFKKMASLKRKISWNWVSFLLPEYWLISRKCYVPGILISFFHILTSVLVSISGGTIMNLNVLSGNVDLDLASKNVVALLTIGTISIALNVFMGMFGDYIYKKKVFSTLKILKSKGATDEYTMLRVGGVNLFLPMMLYFSMNIVSMLVLTIIS